MASIAIITDTDCSIPLTLAAQHQIEQVPIGVHFGEDILDAVFDVSDKQLFERIDAAGKLPTTSAPSAGKWTEAYQKAFERGADSIICFAVSSAVSGTYGSAVAGAELMPGKDITVVDTQSVAIGQGFMVLEAAEAAEAGATKEEVIARAFDVQQRTVLYGALATLRYLAMSGRIGYLAAGFGQMLNVKPILTIRDGKLDLLEKVRTKKKAWARVIDLAKTALDGKAIERLAILHADAEEAARQFEAQLRETIDCPEEIIFSDLTPGLSVHTGQGIVGVSFVKKP